MSNDLWDIFLGVGGFGGGIERNFGVCSEVFLEDLGAILEGKTYQKLRTTTKSHDLRTKIRKTEKTVKSLQNATKPSKDSNFFLGSGWFLCPICRTSNSKTNPDYFRDIFGKIPRHVQEVLGFSKTFPRNLQDISGTPL